MDQNNKFGVCCKCPALNDGRFLTNYVPRRDYNYTVMNQVNASNSNEYRAILQEQGENLLNVIEKTLNDNFVCKNTDNNIFYKDINYNKFFNDQLQSELNKKVDTYLNQ